MKSILWTGLDRHCAAYSKQTNHIGRRAGGTLRMSRVPRPFGCLVTYKKMNLLPSSSLYGYTSMTMYEGTAIGPCCSKTEPWRRVYNRRDERNCRRPRFSAFFGVLRTKIITHHPWTSFFLMRFFASLLFASSCSGRIHLGLKESISFGDNKEPHLSRSWMENKVLLLWTCCGQVAIGQTADSVSPDFKGNYLS